MVQVIRVKPGEQPPADAKLSTALGGNEPPFLYGWNAKLLTEAQLQTLYARIKEEGPAATAKRWELIKRDLHPHRDQIAPHVKSRS